LSNEKWYSGPAVVRELLLHGDSVTEQVWRILGDVLAEASGVEWVLERPKSKPDLAGKLPAAIFAKRLERLPCTKTCHRHGSLHVCFLRTNINPIIEESAACLLQASPDDVHVFNTGLWIHSKGEAASAVRGFRRFIEYAREAGMTLPRIVWRETTPQHFASSPYGTFVERAATKKTKKTPQRCMSAVDEAAMKKGDFRNKVAFAVLKGMEDIDVFKAWEMLMPLAQHHKVERVVKKPGPPDCTHWCETPDGPMFALCRILISDIFKRYWGHLL
jgi:hypothetical protein